MENYLDIVRRMERNKGTSPDWSDDLSALGPAGPITIEPAAPNTWPVYWEQVSGEILGPAKPEFLAHVGNESKVPYWVIALYEGLPVWIRSDRLRSRQAFEQQVKPRPVQLIRELSARDR